MSARRPPSATTEAYRSSSVLSHQKRVPSYSSTSSRGVLSTTLPVRCAVAPHELLPIIPPSVQLGCVEGSGPYRRPVGASRRFSSSSTIPGSTTHRRRSTSTETTWWQYFVQSITTAALVHWPARLVPPPRESTGAPCSRHTATLSTAASPVRGTTTPIGTCRKFEAALE